MWMRFAGHGTLDVSILECNSAGQIEVMSTSGCKTLGGVNFEWKIRDYVLAELNLEDDALSPAERVELAELCKLAKETLTDSDTCGVEVGNHREVIITRDQFETDTKCLVYDMQRYMEDALERIKWTVDDIAEVVPVGGAVRIPAIERALRDFFPKAVYKDEEAPDEWVVKGAAEYMKKLKE